MTASNTLLTPTVIAKEALRLLDNNLVLGSLVNRAYEDEYAKKVNGYKVGATVEVDRPVRYTVRTNATASPQNSISSAVNIVVNKVAGVDLQFSTTDLTLNVSRFSEKYLKSAMVQIANQVDMDIAKLYQQVWNWVGTPGQTINSIPDFFLAPQRMDEMAVPKGERCGFLSPADNYGLLGNLTGLYMQGTNKTALEKAKLPEMAGIDLYDSQNVQTLTCGTRTGGSPVANVTTQVTTYAGGAAFDNSQTLNVTGAAPTTTGTIKAGEVFTLASVYAVNPVSKAVMPYLQQFTVLADATVAGDGTVALTISPQIISSGAYQTVSGVGTSQALTFMGTASTGYSQNIVFHRDAFALCCVPMALHEGMVNPARETYKGLSLRVVPYYDGTNDLGNWRLDVLYGTKTVYPDLATRISGTA